MRTIPFNEAYLTGRELGFIRQAVTSRKIAGDGPYTIRCESRLKILLHAPRVLLTSSGTHALEMAGLLTGVKPGDEVIVPSFTFTTSASAFALLGARPVFADIRPDTQNIDERLLERLITRKTRAIVVVHYGGIACEMDTIMRIARRHGIRVIEDNSHGLFGAYKGRQLGTIGHVGTQSFHETKNFSCGEGGALIVNHRDLVNRAEAVRDCGTNRQRFLRKEVPYYSWIELGSSYLMADTVAAHLYAQLLDSAKIQARRKQVFLRYARGLKGWAERNGVQLPVVPDGCVPAYHLFYLRLPSRALRKQLQDYLRSRGIMAAFHYPSLHLSAMGHRFGGKPGQCPESERASQTLLRLPFFTSMTAAQVDRVIDDVLSWRS